MKPVTFLISNTNYKKRRERAHVLAGQVVASAGRAVFTAELRRKWGVLGDRNRDGALRSAALKGSGVHCCRADLAEAQQKKWNTRALIRDRGTKRAIRCNRV